MEEFEKEINEIIENSTDACISIDDTDEETISDFIEETKEHIENIVGVLLDFENINEKPEGINSLFREFHTIKGIAGFVNQLHILNIAHETENLLDIFRKNELNLNFYYIDILLKSSDFIKQIVIDLSIINKEEFCKNILNHTELLSQLIKEIQSNSEKIEIKQVESNESPDTILNKPENNSLVRVSSQKINSIVDMVGELIINQSLIEQETFGRLGSNDKLSDYVLRVSRIIKNLQKTSLSLNMVSLKSTFQKLNRIARNTIAECGKNAVVNLSGEETEIDRSVADRLLDPLIHIIKNSISHGIEPEEIRIREGKPPQGTITVQAYNKRGSVYIVVTDDGAGLCTDKICKKALNKGIVDSNSKYTREQILNFIFKPGFSTAEIIDSISGRGVGMDVVKTEMRKIGGKVDIIDNQESGRLLNPLNVCPCISEDVCQKGKGLKLTLKIPVNMAMLNGTIVDISNNKYIIPTLQIKSIYKPEKNDWISVKGKVNMIKIRNEIIPLISISDVLGIESVNYQQCILAILEQDGKYKALPVNSIVDKRDIVVKPLGDDFANLKYVSGASILGDGKVSIILDIEYLFANENNKEGK